MLKRLVLISAVLFFMVAAAEAKIWRTENYSYDSRPISVVEIDHPVGNLSIVAGSSEQIEVEMRVECSSRRNKCGAQTENIELDVREAGGKLELRVEGFPKSSGSLAVNLKIVLPARVSLDIDRGVGETDVRNILGDISVESGVGEVRIAGSVASVGSVEAECGVGDANLDIPGGRIKQDGFLFLGNEVKWRGTGSAAIEVELGVGSIHIDLR